MKTSTPDFIRRAWNDGLFNLREKRNGNARGNSIEDKVMYVLGLGYKISGSGELRDSDIQNTLNVTLTGLTQEGKFSKIGQVLWNQCDKEFILQMIQTLANIGPAQSRMYDTIAKSGSKDYRDYFTRGTAARMARAGVNPQDVLDRESKQINSNVNLNRRHADRIRQEKENRTRSRSESRGFDKMLTKYKPTSDLTKKLAIELEYILKTTEVNNIADIAQKLNIEVEDGYDKRFLIEEIKSSIVSYVEIEMMGKNMGNKVYLRPGYTGIETIKRLLKFTSMWVLGIDGHVTIEQLNKMEESSKKMKSNMSRFVNNNGRFKDKSFAKYLDNKDRMSNDVSASMGAKSKKKTLKGSKYFDLFYNEVISKLASDKDMLYLGTGPEASVLSGRDAVIQWWNTSKTDEDMAAAIGSNESLGNNSNPPTGILTFTSKTAEQLLEDLMNTAFALGIEVHSAAAQANSQFLETSPGYYMLLIIKKFAAIVKQGSKRRNRKRGILKDVIDSFGENLDSRLQKSKDMNEHAEENADGIFLPVRIKSSLQKDWYDKMQPVYIMGGSVYSFATGSGSGSGVDDSGAKERIGRSSDAARALVNVQGRWSGGRQGRLNAIQDAKDGVNMGAFGTPNPLIGREDGEGAKAYLQRLILSKSMDEWQEFKGAGDMKYNNSVQPVFLINKGINTSNIELTALLNMLPPMLHAIPLIGTAASAIVDSMMQSSIDSAKNLPKFALGGSFNAVNNNVSQFISGDSINNKMNPERVTIDWAKQRVNVQPLDSGTTINNVSNIQKGEIRDPITGGGTTKLSNPNGHSSEAVNVYNAVNPFGESIGVDGVSLSPMEVFISMTENLTNVLLAIQEGNQIEVQSAAMTAKVVDAVNNLNNALGSGSGGSSGSKNIFNAITTMARGD